MKILLFLILFPCFVYCQDFTGVWTGTITMQKSQFPYELVISGEKSDLSGYALTVYIINDIENTGIKTIKIKNKKTSIAIEDDELVFSDYKITPKKVTLYARLSFTQGNSSILEGSFFTRSADKTSFTGTIHVERNDAFAKTRLITHLERMHLLKGLSFLHSPADSEANKIVASNQVIRDTVVSQPEESVEEKMAVRTPKISVPVVLPAQTRPIMNTTASPKLVQKTGLNTFKVAADIASRETEILRNIEFKSDSLVLSLYDNGEVDGDTVSVLVNDKIVIAMQGLSANPIRTTIYIPPGSTDSLQVTMYAENLGRIAPNTGLLVVEDGKEKYQVRFEGDFKKNSAIIFHRRHN